MPRPKTPYIPPPPPLRIKPDSVFSKTLSNPFSGPYGSIRLLTFICAGMTCLSGGVLVDAYLLRPDKYPTPDRSYLDKQQQGELTWSESFEVYKRELKDLLDFSKPL